MSDSKKIRKWYIVGKGTIPAMENDHHLHEEFSGGYVSGYGDRVFKCTEEEFDKKLEYLNSLGDDQFKIIGCGDYDKFIQALNK